MSEECILICDDRERKVIGKLKERKVKIIVKRLELGDYQLTHNGKTFIIERKTLKDLAASFLDGRIDNIEKAMRYCDGKYKYIILFECSRRVSKIPYSTLNNLLISYQLRGVPVLYVKNINESCDMLLSLFKHCNITIPLNYQLTDCKSPEYTVRVKCLSKLVSWDLANQLTKLYGDIKKLLNNLPIKSITYQDNSKVSKVKLTRVNNSMRLLSNMTNLSKFLSGVKYLTLENAKFIAADYTLDDFINGRFGEDIMMINKKKLRKSVYEDLRILFNV